MLMRRVTSTFDCQTKTPKQSNRACVGNCEKQCTDPWMQPNRWREHCAQVLETGRFSRGVASPRHFSHKDLETYIRVHGDDFSKWADSRSDSMH